MEFLENSFTPYSLKVVPHILPEQKFNELLKSNIKQGESFNIDFLKSLYSLVDGDRILKELIDFDISMAKSIENQTTQLELDVDQLLNELKVRPQEIFFEINPSAHIIKCHPEIPHLWHRIVLSKNPRSETLKIRGLANKLPEQRECFLICTLMGNTEIHQLSEDFYNCMQFLRDDSTSLEALIFEFFDASEITLAEKFVGKMISLGAFKNYKLLHS